MALDGEQKSSDCRQAFRILPSGDVHEGGYRRAAVSDVSCALRRLGIDLAAYVGTREEVDQVLAKMHRREVAAG